MKKMKLMLCGIALLLLVPVIGYQAYDANTTLNAETTEIDDSPLGEKIVDIESGSYGYTYYALTEKGEIYAWGLNLSGELANGIEGGQATTIPKKVLNSETATNGEYYLSNVVKLYTGGYSGNQYGFSGGHVIAITKEGKVYGWGSNDQYNLGFPDKKSYTKPTEILLPDELNGNDIEKFELGYNVSFLLTKYEDVYSTGNTTYGNLGLGSSIKTAKGFTKIEKDNDGDPLPRIVDVASQQGNSYFLSDEGYIYACGSDANVTGQGKRVELFSPAKVKIDATTYLSGITEIISSTPTTTLLTKSQSGDIYDTYDKDYGSGKYFFAPLLTKNLKDPFNIIGSISKIHGKNGGGLFIGSDHRLYTIYNYGESGFTSNLSEVKRYSEGAISEDYVNAKKAMGNYALQDYILTNEGSVYLDGVKIGFGDILITGKKTENNKTYKHEEKYNGDISVLASTASIGNLKCREKDLTNGTISEDKTGSASLDIKINSDERIHKTYEFFLGGQEAQTKTSFTIDLYKKEPVIADVKNNGVYQPNKAITLGYNGFSENTITAQLKKKNEEAIEYISETPINATGYYDLIVTDQYGNTRTYNFEITDKPVAESISFTKNPNGELTYANAITKSNNQIGTISLVYPVGTSASTIASAIVKNEGDGVNFEIKNNNQLYVKTSDLTAKEYTIPIEGEDTNGMPFSGEVKITIAKATQTMAWDETSAKLAEDGIALGDEVTLGVKDKLGNVDVAYGLKSPNSCFTMNGNNVKVTCIPNPASVTFTATPSGNDNYTSDPIELNVTISKKSISLKTVIQDSDTTFKDSVSVKVGDTPPSVKVVDLEGKEVHDLGTPTLTFKKNGSVFADPTIESGTYSVEANYPSGSAADNYTITWTSKASLIVSDITIDENNASDYYTLSSDGKTYTPNTWTNQPIIITPVHKDFNLMSVENANTFSSSPYSYNVEGSKEVKLTFATADGAKASTKVTLNYDKTKPVMTSFQYDDVNSPVRAVLRSLFGFTHYFDQEKSVKFIGSDESTGSGVKEYTYEIVELNVDGSEITSSKKTGTLDSVNSVKLEMDKNYKITAKVIDNAGNPSEPMSETVQLNDEIGDLSLSAVSDGLPYDGSKWTSKAINITLTGSNKSGVKKYQYSMDGTAFIDFTSSDGTITLPSPLVSIDNKTYTFRAINNDGTTNDKTLSLKVDTEKPVIKVKGMIGNTLYDGSEVDQDVTIIPYQENESLSDITYYYTNEESSKNTGPLNNTNWKKYTGVLSETRNGSHTYYFKGVNGAGVQSDTENIIIKIAKKEYTKVNVEATSEAQPYTSGTWAKHDITFTLSGGLSDESIITGYEVTTTRDGSRPSATAIWTSVNGNKKHVVTANSEQETYWFRVLPKDPNGTISKGTLINLDVEKPEKPTFTMEEVNTNAFARFVNTVSFGQWMKAGVKVTINSNDGISGLDHFTYEEITNDGRIEKQSTNGILYYEEDAKLTLQAKAYDKAGNVSDVSEESGDILIDTTPPVITGVKDQDVYKKYYYVYRTIAYTDEGSGIDDASAIIKKEGVSSPLSQNEKIKDIGSYEVSVQDNAGNETVVRFQLVPLPDIDTEIDGTDESKDIIDQVKEELEEERNNLAPDEIKDYEKWIEDAIKKWESERKKKLEDKETGTIIEGEGDTSFDPNTVLIVDEIDESKVPSLPRRAINVYDVYMKKGDTVIQPDGSVKVYLPYTEKETPIVYEIDEKGNVKEIKGTVENGFVTFVTDTLKKYAISNEAQKENKKDVCVVGPDKDLDTKDDVCGSEDSTKNPDGSVDVPDGGKVIFPDKEIDAPDGAHINPDGSVDFPDGSHYDPDGNLKPKDEENNTCTAGPDGKLGTSDDVCGEGNGTDDPKKNEDGSVDVPDGGTIHFPDKEIDVPDGAHINPDGSVELPDGTEYDKDGNKKPKVCEIKNGVVLNKDSDGDGKADINIDVNGDGYANLNILKLTKWIPDKNDCEYEGFLYDTMSNLKADTNIDSDGDGKADTNLTDKDGNPIDTSVKSNYNTSNTQGVGGAGTGDSTKWFIWSFLMILTSGTMCYHIYRGHKRKQQI